jgi:eukaryotic-like serine/threonine-protein kinase
MTATDTRIDQPSDVWTVVADRLEAFKQAWDSSGSPPEPAAFVPDGPPEVRRMVLVELLKFDLEYRVQRGLDRPVEDYLKVFPELAADGPPSDLLYEDFHVRRQAGRRPDPADYYRRFPQQATDLARLLAETVPGRSVAVFGSRAPSGLAAGDRLDDFDLLALLGEGQFAKVFLARQRTMHRLVALKVSSSQGAEAQALAQLDHPNIVRVYDQRFLPDRGFQLVYMAYLPGGTLRDVLGQVLAVRPGERSGRTLLRSLDAAYSRRGEPPAPDSPARQKWAARSWPATVCALGAKLARALDHAHRQGVLHRDLKPANVLLTADGEPMLADFNVGCCSKLDGAGPSAFFGGSLAYMAPEHLEAFDPDHSRPPESLDGRADTYGLAVTLWEVLTGENPFGSDRLRASWPATLSAMAERRRAGPPAEAIAAFPEGDVPGFRDALVRCLQGDPDQRPATAGDMARELELCLRPETRDLVRPAPGGWRHAVVRYPLLAIYLLAIVPNVLASLFNIDYNQAEIIDRWSDEAKAAFGPLILAVNAVFFPLGMLFLGVMAWPVARALHRLRAGDRPAAEELARVRRRCLRLGTWSAAVGVGCWAVAGVVWSGALRAAAGPPHQGAQAYVHLFVSLAICGLIAAAYPYFLVTYLAVRALYPALLDAGGPVAEDTPALRQVGRDLSRYRAAAAAVPLVAVGLLASRGVSQPFNVAALTVAGLAGSLLAFVLEGRTRADLAALEATSTAGNFQSIGK